MMDILAPVSLPVSTLSMVLLLGPVVAMWMVAEIREKQGREMSPMVMSALRSTSVVAGVLFLCYFCEHHFPNEHAEKIVNPLAYWGSFAALMIYACFTIRKTSTTDFMPREQTEEWKGWMQFLFLAYHYWKMEQAYSDIRVYITCYLWMTGFGNFSFFYVKQDYSLLRVLQMLWRMNFFVFFLCMTMNNPWIVYYICPLHTAYFLVTYATMGVMQRVNHTEIGAAAEVLSCAAMLYFVYDGVPQIFHAVFGWLGTKSTGAAIGAHGVEWEWYFRSFLDHFSTVWGMVFALNMPFLAEWFKQVESFTTKHEWIVKSQVVGGLGAAMVAWVVYVYSRNKNDYNAVHCYYSMAPLLFYLFVRNVSSTVRSYYLHALHWFGAISLESYLLQYHIWLAANAGKLLNIIPGYPLLTYAIATPMHVFCAYQIFLATGELRKVVLPNDLGDSLRNLALLGTASAVCFVLSHVMLAQGFPIVYMLLAVAGIAAGGWCMILQSEAKGEKKKPLAEAKTSTMVVNGVIASVTGLAVLLGPRLIASFGNHTEMAASFLERAQLQQNMELMASNAQGLLKGFVIGSLAQPWHGAICLALIAVCVVSNDPFFGLCRVAMKLGGEEGKKTISWEQAYGPLLEKLGVRTPDPERAQEQTPLVKAQ